MNRTPEEIAVMNGIEQPIADFRDALRGWSAGVTPPRPVWSAPREASPIAGLRAVPRAATSMMIHATALAMLLTIGSRPEIQTKFKMFATDLVLYVPKPYREPARGGGGGGAREPLPASRGSLPKAAARQFTPPRVDPVEAQLLMPPAIIADASIPEITVTYGDPLGKAGPPSNGPGSGGGIGPGRDGGVGPGDRPGVGPGSRGVFGDGVAHIGGGVTQAVLIHREDPDYSDEARKARFQGAVLISAIIDVNGRLRDIKVVRALGMGLDEKAVEAVRKWIFRPARMNGAPVASGTLIEVSFRLL